MGYTFKLSRRLAQVHICFLAMTVLACADAVNAPEQASEEVSDTDQGGLEVAMPHLTMSTLNQPSNFVQLSNRPFNYKVEAGWRDRGDVAFSIANDAAAPASPSKIGRANFRAGFQGGAAPILTWLDIKNRRGLYLSFWMKLSSNWVGHSSGVNKIFFFQINRGNKVYLSAQGVGGNNLTPQIRVQGINENPVSRNLLPNITAKQLYRGQWHRWELVLRANTNGLRNGVAEWWIDGTKVGSHTNINFVAAGVPNTWEKVKWNPTWGGVGDQLVNAQDMWIDEAYVSGL